MTPLKDTFKLVVSTSHKMHVEGFRQHILKAEQMLNTELPKLRFHIETDQAPALLALVKEAREALIVRITELQVNIKYLEDSNGKPSKGMDFYTDNPFADGIISANLKEIECLDSLLSKIDKTLES